MSTQNTRVKINGSSEKKMGWAGLHEGEISYRTWTEFNSISFSCSGSSTVLCSKMDVGTLDKHRKL